MQMSFNEWESAELLVQYRYKHTQRPCRVSLYGMFETKGSKNGGILSLSSSPCKSTLTQSSLFLFKKKKKYSPQENTSTAAVTRACLHSNRCAPVRLRRSPGTFAWLVGLEKSTDGADSRFRARRRGSPPRRIRMSCWCRPMAVMQMPNRGGGGGWRGGRLAWLGLEVPQALSKNTFPLIALHCSEGLRWRPPSVLYFSASMEPRNSVNLNKEAHLDTTCKNKTKIVSSR